MTASYIAKKKIKNKVIRIHWGTMNTKTEFNGNLTVVERFQDQGGDRPSSRRTSLELFC